jgi:acetyl esterase/lipase
MTILLAFTFGCGEVNRKPDVDGDGDTDVLSAHDAPAESSEDPVLPEGVERVADLVYSTKAGRELRLDVFRPRFSKGPFPAVILIHGGRPGPRDRHHYGPLAAQLADRGLVAVCIDYREALEAPYPAAIEDARAAIRWLETNAEKHRILSGAVAALGEGFGGYVAAMLGVASDGTGAPSASAVVGINPVVDLPNYNPISQSEYSYVFHLFLGFPRAQRPDLWKQASPLEYVDSRAAPFFLFHASKPKRVPIEQSTALVRALEEAGVEVKLFSPEGTGGELLSAPHDVPRFARSVAGHLRNTLWRLPDGVQVRKDLVYASPGGRDLRLDLYLPDHAADPRPAVLLIHGGGWMWGGKDELRGAAAYLAARGFAAACVEYRLAKERIYPAAIDDAKAAVRWLRANATVYGVDGGRIGVAGTSAGAHIAAMLAVTPDKTHFAEGRDSPGVSVEVQAAVPISAPVDMIALNRDDPWSPGTFLGGRLHEIPELWREASPTMYAEKASCAFLFMHATEDGLCRYAHVEAMRQKLVSAGIRAEMFTATGGEHDFFWDLRFRDAALARMASFLEEELGRGRSAPARKDE